MDGQTLQNLFSGTNPFLAQMGEKAFNLDQQKRQADLASIMGQEDRARQMLPLEMEGKGAVTRLNNSTAAMNEDTLAAQIPAAQRQRQKLQESISKMDDVTRAQMKAKVLHSMQLAAAMKKNGGMLPEGFNLSPEEMQIYQPQNLDKIIAHGQAFMEMDPEWLAARKKAEEAQALENTRAQGRIDLKSISGAGGNTVELPKTYGEVVAGMAKYKKASERLAYLKTILPGVSPELQASLQPAYNALKVQADAEANARTANEVNIPGATKGRVPVNPAVDLGDAPSAVANRPQRQTPKITQADLEFTAKKHGITVEEVKKRLGIK